MTSRLDKAEVFAALSPPSVLAHYHFKARRSGDQLRSRQCARRDDHEGEDFAMHSRSGLWLCHACTDKGDMADFIAIREALYVEHDFSKVVAIAAEIAGIDAGPADDAERQRRARARAERQAEAERQAQLEQAAQAKAIAGAASAWERSARRHHLGEPYLESRGLPLAGVGDRVRFWHDGSPAVALHGLEAPHAVINVVRRCLPPAEPKTPGLKDCPTLGVFGDLGQLEKTSGHVVLAEGVADSLTGAVMFAPHGNLVLGAHGAANLPKIVAAIAPRLRELGRSVLYVTHEDTSGAGDRAVEAAIEQATAAGLRFEPGIDLFNLGGASDLNDAWTRDMGDAREYR